MVWFLFLLSLIHNGGIIFLLFMLFYFVFFNQLTVVRPHDFGIRVFILKFSDRLINEKRLNFLKFGVELNLILELPSNNGIVFDLFNCLVGNSRAFDETEVLFMFSFH